MTTKFPHDFHIETYNANPKYTHCVKAVARDLLVAANILSVWR